MKYFVSSIIISIGVALGAIVFFSYLRPPMRFFNDKSLAEVNRAVPQKSVEERVKEAREKSSRIKGLYMTADVANDPGAGARGLREKIIGLAQTTEINGIVIDVKEVCGPDYDEGALKQLIEELHQKNIWVIARVVLFKDASQIQVHPEWYLTRPSRIAVGDSCARKHYLVEKNPHAQKPEVIFWQDKKGGYWMDPASEGVREHLAEFSKKMIDFGFDELQFDYVRFPSDGDVANARYPAWDKKQPKYEVLKSFFEVLSATLKKYKPEVILSADLFGYVASQHEDIGIGQRLEDIGNNFDYISFMVYPSHYYTGLHLPENQLRRLPPVRMSYTEARANPGVVVGRSSMVARDFLDGKLSTTSSATSTAQLPPPREVRLRPWLEDFFHEDDRTSGRPYGEEKVRLQIKGAESVEDHGWLLWNASNVYTENALEKE